MQADVLRAPVGPGAMHVERYAEAPRNVSEEVIARVMGKVEK